MPVSPRASRCLCVFRSTTPPLVRPPPLSDGHTSDLESLAAWCRRPICYHRTADLSGDDPFTPGPLACGELPVGVLVICRHRQEPVGLPLL